MAKGIGRIGSHALDQSVEPFGPLQELDGIRLELPNQPGIPDRAPALTSAKREDRLVVTSVPSL
jgi:hypothetical protein